jgi:hypothetical protein
MRAVGSGTRHNIGAPRHQQRGPGVLDTGRNGLDKIDQSALIRVLRTSQQNGRHVGDLQDLRERVCERRRIVGRRRDEIKAGRRSGM